MIFCLNVSVSCEDKAEYYIFRESTFWRGALATIKRFSFANPFNGMGSRRHLLNGIFNKPIVEIPHYVTFHLEVYMEQKQHDLTDSAAAMNSRNLICSRHYY